MDYARIHRVLCQLNNYKELLMKKVVFYTQAYNSESYIKKCIESVLDQTYKEFDYYLIDNGSTDKTWRIISEYSKKDARIIPVHLDDNKRYILEKYIHIAYNEGYQYIATLDSDDWYEPDFLKEMIELLEGNHADMVTCGSLLSLDECKKTYIKRPSDKVISFEKEDFAKSFPYLYSYYGAIWGRIYKLKIFVENNIESWRNVNFGADTSLVLNYQSYCNKVAFSPKILHNYLIRKKSVSSSFDENSLKSNENFYKNLILYLEKIDGLTKINLTFCSVIYMGLITNTNFNTLLSDDALYETNLRILYNTITSAITVECWNRIKNADSTVKNLIDIGSILSNYTETLLKYICKIYDKKDNDKFYEMLYFLMPLSKELCDEGNVDYWIENSELLHSVINLEENQVALKLIDAILHTKNSDTLWEALKKLLKKNIILNSIDRRAFILEYPDIVKDVYCFKFEYVINIIIDIIANGQENKYEEELLIICLNIAAAQENAALFIVLKKLQAELYIQERRVSEAFVLIDDLIAMCPNDEDVITLKKYLEEEYE
jgi:glycosyltransferase involved in cell wall biosynthesis